MCTLLFTRCLRVVYARIIARSGRWRFKRFKISFWVMVQILPQTCENSCALLENMFNLSKKSAYEYTSDVNMRGMDLPARIRETKCGYMFCIGNCCVKYIFRTCARLSGTTLRFVCTNAVRALGNVTFSNMSPVQSTCTTLL